MNKYYFEVDTTQTDYYTVEAENEAQANKKFNDGDFEEEPGRKVWESTSHIAKVEEIEEEPADEDTEPPYSKDRQVEDENRSELREAESNESRMETQSE